MTAVAVQLAIPNVAHLFDQIRANARHASRMAQPGSAIGRTLTIAGGGPSLADLVGATLATDDVWACNSALPYLRAHGGYVTHGFCVDQGREMLGAREWAEIAPVDYLLASTVHPDLADTIVDAGACITWFHNFCGLADPPGWTPPAGYDGCTLEHVLYASLYPPGPQVGYGLNSVPRALCLALWMGYDRIHVIGADHAARPNGDPMPAYGTPAWEPWLRGTVLYADGRTAFDAYGRDISMIETVIDGVRWHTRPDMVISAQHLANLVMANPGRITLGGLTLPGAMLGKPREWFDTCPALTLADGVTGFTLVEAAA